MVMTASSWSSPMDLAEAAVYVFRHGGWVLATIILLGLTLYRWGWPWKRSKPEGGEP